MGYRRRPLSAAVARFFMHIIGIVVYGTAITAARTVGLNSGSGQHNNDTIAKHNLNNNFEDACDGSDCFITDNRIGYQAMHNHTGQTYNHTGQIYNHTGQTHCQNDRPGGAPLTYACI